MLTFAEYENLWNAHFAGINGLRGQLMPPYNQYLEAENMLEDYLDIFRGVNTRNLRANGDNPWYYDHPFFDGDTPKLKEKPCIKYIMIGEARPKLKNDKPGTYFYNVNHLGSTGWLREPFKAFNNNVWNQPLNPLDKIKILLNLASKGYLLIDLYPFNLNYGFRINGNQNLRHFLSNEEVGEFFFNRLITMLPDHLFCKENTPIIAFSGPAITHHHIVHKLANHRILLPLNINSLLMPNYFIEPIAIPALFPLPEKIIPWNPLIHPLNADVRYIRPNNIFYAPFYRCECWDGAYQNPNEIFIRTAFNL